MANKKLTQEDVKEKLLKTINFVFTNNGARSEQANEIRSYEIEDGKITGVFVGVQNFAEKLFEFEATNNDGEWSLEYGYLNPELDVAKNNALLYFPKNMKKATHRYYRESNTALDECGVLVRPALLLTEGTITDSLGQRTTYTRDLIDAIVEASNNYCASNEIKLFNDHEYSQESRIGSVTGKFSAREITDFDIPEGGDRSIIGKYAIFNDGLEIRSEDAIEQYHSGLLKELSVGIDLKGSVFGKNVIYEVSAVPFPAVAEAHLYSKGEKPMEEDTSKYAFTFESQMRRVQKEMSEDDMKSMSARERGYNAFARAMDNINDATDDELPKSRYKSVKSTITAFSDYLMGIYAPKPDEEPETVPIVMMEKPMEETTTYNAQVEEMKAEIAKLRKEADDSRKFAMHQSRAIALRESGKLSPVLYNQHFGNDGLATYQAFQSKDPLEAFLDGVEASAKVDARFGASVYGATPLRDQDVPERPESEAKAIKERAAAIQASKVSY